MRRRKQQQQRQQQQTLNAIKMDSRRTSWAYYITSCSTDGHDPKSGDSDSERQCETKGECRKEGERVTHKRQCAAAKVMAQATGDSRRQSDDGETKRSDSESKPSKTWRKFLFIFFFPFLFVFLWKPNLGPRPYTPTHTHTGARTVGQWKQCINMISRTTAEQSREQRTNAISWTRTPTRARTRTREGHWAMSRSPASRPYGNTTTTTNTASTTTTSSSDSDSDSASTAQIAGATHVHVPDTRYNSRDTRLLWELLSKCHVNSVQSRRRRCGSAADASRGRDGGRGRGRQRRRQRAASIKNEIKMSKKSQAALSGVERSFTSDLIIDRECNYVNVVTLNKPKMW